MKIKRRINGGKKEVIEKVKLIEKRKLKVLVQLSNGDIINRRYRDVVEWDKENEL